MGGRRRGRNALLSADHSMRTCKLPCAFCTVRHLPPLSLFYTCTYAEGLFEFCAGSKFWFDNSQSWNNLFIQRAGLAALLKTFSSYLALSCNREERTIHLPNSFVIHSSLMRLQLKKPICIRWDNGYCYEKTHVKTGVHFTWCSSGDYSSSRGWIHAEDPGS